jgi:prepilin-type N-terminal cleavage/methylation domain-containing protein
MFSGLKIEAARREKLLAVEWCDCSWVPRITVRAARPPVRRHMTKPLLPSPPVLHTVRRNQEFLITMKTISRSSRRPRAGFTLVELLVVIAIIGILAGMVMAVIPGVVKNAKKAKAKLEAQDIATAIQHYDSVYGRFPVSSGGAPNQSAQSAAGAGDFTYGAGFQIPGGTLSLLNANYAMSNSEVIAILMDYTNFPDGSGATANLNYQKNPQKTVFLNAHMSGDPTAPGVGPDLVYRDPWGNPYVITMDLNYDENCWDIFYGSTTLSGPAGLNGLIQQKDNLGNPVYGFHGKVMVWSAGPDKKVDPGMPANQSFNKDNVLSW